MIDGSSSRRGLRQTVDWWIIVVYLALVIIGWVNIYAATHTAEAGSMLDWGSRAGKQFVRAARRCSTPLCWGFWCW